MKWVIASDHAGLELKADLLNHLRQKGIPVEDLGPATQDSVDYPDFARKVAQRVYPVSAEYPSPPVMGILVCGTGIGMSIMANKQRGVRAALCHTEFEAKMARAHNDANVLCLGQRVVGAGLARSLVDVFGSTPFEGGRHELRVAKINEADGHK